jgi:hypothetical protein
VATYPRCDIWCTPCALLESVDGIRRPASMRGRCRTEATTSGPALSLHWSTDVITHYLPDLCIEVFLANRHVHNKPLENGSPWEFIACVSTADLLGLLW